MKVERLKYVIWSADMPRAVRFYTEVFGGTVLKQNDFIAEVAICDGIIGIHGGGFGERTWTGLSFQVSDVIAGAAEIVAAGGQLVREPEPEDNEPPHLAMCVDTEGNGIMLTRKRGWIIERFPMSRVKDAIEHPRGGRVLYRLALENDIA